MGKLIQKSTKDAALEISEATTEVSDLTDWKSYLNLPSAEHRAHIRRFGKQWFLSDEQDVALRHYVAYRRWSLVTERVFEKWRRENERE